VTVTVASGADERYEILNVIGFTSARRRMSVIVRTPDSGIKLFCKVLGARGRTNYARFGIAFRFQGADTAIFGRLSTSGGEYKNRTAVHLNNFARAGYRTLCFAYANVSERFYAAWNDEYVRATAVVVNRDRAQDRVAEKIEKRLILVGATAIENDLQDNVGHFSIFFYALIRVRCIYTRTRVIRFYSTTNISSGTYSACTVLNS